ncbi:MAG: winged helix-turn-helix domain-containing protein [Casimicrobiaceae bacterium]
MTSVHRFGRCELRAATREVLIDGAPVAVGHRAFDLLSALIERADRLVSKSELLDLVWPGLVVEENNLQVQISTLRKLLGPLTIATVPGRGYRFAVALEGEGKSEREVTAADEPAPTTAVATATGASRLTNLPSHTDGLIGRDADISSLTKLLVEHRLVTVLGAGGIGKTRLAQAVSRRLVGAYANGVWWVDLAALSSADKIVPAIANAAGLQLGDGDAVVLLTRALAQRESLLVLDSCEHVVAEVARVVTAILQSAQTVSVLATSQETLKAPGEYVYRLDALAIPPAGTPLDQARTYSAMQLLEWRAQAASRHFRLTDATVAGAIGLCRQLDGIALSIEMAAARLPMLGIAGLQERLGERLRLLRSSTRDAPARYQTLRATLDWSHSLLTEDEQAVLHRLAVFAGSFRLDVAQAVASGNDLDQWAALDALAALVDKSLVQLEGNDPPRYRLLETTRIYSSELLAAGGGTESALLRHGVAMARLAAQAEADYWSMADSPWLARYAADYDDMQAAFERACARGDAEVAAATSEALLWMDDLRNDLSTLRTHAEAAHALLPMAGPLARARLWNRIAGHNILAFTEVPRLVAARNRVGCWRSLDDPRQLCLALGFLSGACARAREFDAADKALAEAKALEDPDWPPRLRYFVAYSGGFVSIFRANADAYRASGKVTLALAEEAGAERAAGMARLALADATLMAGDVDEAVRLGREAVAVLRSLAQPSNLGIAMGNLASALMMKGDVASARATAAEALPLLWRNEMGSLLFELLALLAVDAGDFAVAAQMLGFAQSRYAATEDVSQANEARMAQMATAAIDAALGKDIHAQLRDAGALLTAEQARALQHQILSNGCA